MNLSPRAQLIATIAGVVVVLLIFFLFFLKPRQTSLSDARAQVDSEQATTQQLSTQLAQLKSIKANAPQLRNQLAKLNGAVPDNDQIAGFILQVQKEADKAGVDFVQVTPAAPAIPPEGTSLGQVGVTIAADGSYFSLQDLVNRIYHFKRALRVDTLTMASQQSTSGTTGTSATSSGPATINMQLGVRIFFQPPPGAAPIAGTSGTTVAPTPTPSPSG